MKKMLNKKFYILFYTTIFLLSLSIIGMSFGYYKANVTGTTTSQTGTVGTLKINFVESNTISITNAYPIYEAGYKENANKTSFSINGQENNTNGCYKLELEISQISETLKDETFRWILYNNTTNTVMSGGNFLGSSTSSNLLLLDGQTLTSTTNTSYTLYIFLIYSESKDQISMTNTSFTGKIKGTVSVGTCSESTKEISLAVSPVVGMLYVGGSSTTASITGKNLGSLSCYSSNTSVATCSISSSTLTVTPGLVEGISVITIREANGTEVQYVATTQAVNYTVNLVKGTGVSSITIESTKCTAVTVGSEYVCTYGSTLKITATSLTGYTISNTLTSSNTSTFASQTNGQTFTLPLMSNGTNITLTANATANIYAITLNNANATTNGTGIIYEKYNTGWYSNSSATTSISSITIPVRSYTVTYNYNGNGTSNTSTSTAYTFGGYKNGSTTIIGANGSISGSNASFTSETSLSPTWTSTSVTLPSPTRTGYTLSGWYTASSGGTRVGGAGSTYTPTSSLTLYAQWTANTYTLVLNLLGNITSTTIGGCSNVTAISGGYQATCTYDQVLSLTNVTPTTGYSFTGWTSSSLYNLDTSTAKYGTTNNPTTQYTGSNVTSAYFKNLTPTNGQTVTLFANWSLNRYTVTYNNNGGSGCSSTTVTYGSSYGSLCTPTRSGYTFNGWMNSGGLIVTSSTTVTTAADHTLTAQWTASIFYFCYWPTYSSNALKFDVGEVNGTDAACSTGCNYIGLYLHSQSNTQSTFTFGGSTYPGTKCNCIDGNYTTITYGNCGWANVGAF